MPENEWQRRIARAEELGSQHRFAAEILRFYAAIARFQGRLYDELSNSHTRANQASGFAQPLPPEHTRRFESFLSVVEGSGPGALRQAAAEIRNGGADSHLKLLSVFWNGNEYASLAPGPEEFFARAFLQPYAAHIRCGLTQQWSAPTPFVCPFCKRKPGVGVLRPLGEGGKRSLVCSFCLAEWEFRRIVCPGCGEENHANLPVYAAEELTHVRVEACDSCKIYIKTVDMTKTGRAEPVVDEIASIALDLWAQKQGYAKLQPNLLQL